MRYLSLAIVLGLAVLSAPAFAQKPSSDDELHDKVIARLAADRDVKGGGIDVEVKDGVVTLSGKIREQRQKVKAERIARKVPGVKQVINRLQAEFGAPPDEGAAKPSK
jgi:osmotically-inducible protein OsmY